MKPIFLSLKEEKAALTKEVSDLKEESSNALAKFNLKVSEIQQENELALKNQQAELIASKNAAEKYEASRAESEISIKSLEEKLQQALQEIINSAATVAEEKKHAELLQSSSQVELETKTAEVSTEKKWMIVAYCQCYCYFTVQTHLYPPYYCMILSS